MSVFGSGDQNSQTPFGGFSFGAPASTAATNLASQTPAATNLFGTSTATPFGGFGATTTSTPSLFGGTPAPAFSGSLFPTASTASTFPTLGQTTSASTTGGFAFGQTTSAPTAGGFSFGQTTSAPTTGGFAFGGFGNPVTSGATFGATSLVPSSTTVTTTTATIGLGGVDIQSSSSVNGPTTASKKDGKTVKESQIPNEITVSVESFKKYVKEQKAIREEMTRVSSKNIFKVQELVGTLQQQLSVVSNGLYRNAIAIAKLKDESNQELKHAEIAQRTKDSLTSIQYENNASTEYFHNLANSFEKQMQSYRQQIELLERHLLSLSQPYSLTPNEWTAIRKRLHDTFVTLAAQLQTVHQEVQLYKEKFINSQRLSQGDMRIFMEKCRENMKDSMALTHLPPSVTYGPSPFAAMQSAVGKAITNVFNHSQQLPGSNASFGSFGLESSSSQNRQQMLCMSIKRVSSFQNLSPFKPLGPTGVPSFGGLSDSSSSANTFGLDNQKPFQLQKPPAGNKRGKRITST